MVVVGTGAVVVVVVGSIGGAVGFGGTLPGGKPVNGGGGKATPSVPGSACCEEDVGAPVVVVVLPAPVVEVVVLEGGERVAGGGAGTPGVDTLGSGRINGGSDVVVGHVTAEPTSSTRHSTIAVAHVLAELMTGSLGTVWWRVRTTLNPSLDDHFQAWSEMRVITPNNSRQGTHLV